MKYHSDSRQSDVRQQAETPAKASAQSAAAGTFVDQRASAAAHVQLKAMIDASARQDSARTISQMMAADSADAVQMVEEEESLQGKFEAVQRVEEEEPLQGKFDPLQRAAMEEEEPLQGKFEAIQRVEEEEPLQGKFDPLQRAAMEEEEPLQGKFEAVQRVEEEEPLQGKFDPLQRAAMEEEEPLQGKFEAIQRVEEEEPLQGKFNGTAAVQRKENNTGLPNQLKSGIENLSGMSMDHVKVHYNSPQPAQLNAHAFAQGSEIHVAPGQEKHLPHEAWHVVQQAQGRVKPTTQMKGNVPVNDDAGLEQDADVMGAKAAAAGAALKDTTTGRG